VKTRIITHIMVAAAIAVPATAGAQTVGDVLTFLITNQSVQTGSVDRDRDAAQATSDTIARALRANLATLPVTTSSGAFVYRLNPELGTVERATETYGPFFIERALTAGRGQASFGVTFQHVRFDSLGGASLRDGTLVTTANQFVDERVPFDTDTLTLNIDADIATLYGSVGIGDQVEVGFAAPLVSLRLNGARTNTYRGRTFTQATANASVAGLADLIVRTKYNFYEQDGAGLAAAVDVRLPTGSEEDLLGAGSTSLRFSAIGSVERGRTSVHSNAGITVGGLARELSYGGALSLAASGHVTVTGELLGRWLDSPGNIVQVAAAHPRLAGVETIRLTPDTSTLHIITLVPGVKWNVADTWVLAANVAIPLTSGGLTSRFVPFVGLDYSLGR
jgi:outer membrane putative beta-barrel porin/alpha-amylase